MGATMDDETLLRLFEQGTFPADQWGHREHVKVAYLLLRRYPLAESTDRMRSALQAFATIHSVPNVLERGYHETITLVWMQLVHFTLCEYGPAESADHFYEQHPELSQSRALRFFYSRDRLMSWEAKQKFVDPDITPLPKPKNR
jgi:hypothetical protein